MTPKKTPQSLLTHPTTGEIIAEEDFIAGLAKGLSILDCFSTERQKLTVTQAAERAEISRTAARRYLRTLKYLGYLDSDDRFYWLTHKVLRLSGAYYNTATLPKIARPILHELSTKTRCCHSIVALDNAYVVTLASSYPTNMNQNRVLPYGIYTGNRIPAHSASNGKVLLAALSQKELDDWLVRYPLTRFTRHTIVDKDLFRADIAKVARQGWSLNYEEHELGFGGLAVPILNAEGKVVYGLNAVDYIANVNKESWQDFCLSQLQEAALYLRTLL